MFPIETGKSQAGQLTPGAGKICLFNVPVAILASIFVFVFLSICTVNLSAESTFDHKSRELQTLKKAIRQQQKILHKKNRQKDKELKYVKTIEKSISQLVASIHSATGQLAAYEVELGRLQNNLSQKRQSLEEQQNAMTAEIQAAYALSRQHRVKLMLNQKNPSDINRLLTYQQYISRAREETMEMIAQGIKNIEQLSRDIDEKKAASVALASQKKTELTQLETQKTQRKGILKSLSAQLIKQNTALALLEKNSEDVSGLIASLREALADIPLTMKRKPFQGMKGKLAWPATGRLVQLFGTKLKNSNQISRGVTIRAQEGGDVRVISHGRVAFADWLRGFGLLLIIDHGDGFMSLYGHNQSLYKEVGEWVDTGDVVSVLGSSGAQANSGLYFELRHEGSPVDPLKWCQGKPG